MATEDKKTEKTTTDKKKTTAKKAVKKTASKAAKSKKSSPKKQVQTKSPAKSAKKTASGKSSSKKTVSRPRLASKTYFPKAGEIQADWKLFDAEGQNLGRLSTKVARTLMGKEKACYTPGHDTGDFVVVVNAEKVKLTGKKWDDKVYHYHTHFPGGIKSFTPRDLLEKHPERIIERAVYGMLPKGHLGRKWFKKLRVYAGTKHPHEAQNPKPVTLSADK